MASKTSQLLPVNMRAGIFKNATAIESGNAFSYVNADKVRFKEQKPQKLGGWEREITSNQPLGCIRSMHTWQALDTTLLLLAVSHNHFYVKEGGTYYDITPIRDTSSLTDALTTVEDSATVVITDSLHGANIGDFIVFSSSVTYNGITLLGEYEVLDVPSANTFEILASTDASASGTGGGEFSIDYLLESGLCDSGAAGFGWGTSTWSASTWGTPRLEGITADARVCSIENWGEDILILPVEGKLYFWDTSVGVSSRAAAVAGVPDRSNWMIVSSYFRQCILFGTKTIGDVYDPLLIRWSDNEDYTEFDPTVEGSNAGEYRLTQGTRIISAIETRNGEILVFTDKAVYRMRPRNDDLVYEVTLVSDTSGIISPKAVMGIDGRVMWVSEEGFRLYDGTVKVLPSTLDLFYFNSNSDGYINQNQKVKCHMGRNREFDEVWFFLPDKDNSEINRYIIYNYKENSWYDGFIKRTAWNDALVYDKPYAFSCGGVLYSHEDSYNADGAPMESFLQTGDIKLDPARTDMLFIDRFIFDGDFNTVMELELNYKKFPNSVQTFTKEYTFLPTTNQVHVRARGGYLNFKLTSNTVNGNYRLGEILAAVQPSGRR